MKPHTLTRLLIRRNADEDEDEDIDVDVDELDYLSGEGVEDEEAPELFDADFQPMDVLQLMRDREQGGAEQPFDVLSARQARGRGAAEVRVGSKDPDGPCGCIKVTRDIGSRGVGRTDRLTLIASLDRYA